MSGYRAEKAGFAKEVQDKLAGKFDKVEAAKTLRWIKSLPADGAQPAEYTNAVGQIPNGIQEVEMGAYQKYLSNGLVLGYLMHALQPGFVKFTTKTWQVSDKPVFETSRQRERIGVFLDFCSKYGVSSAFMFQTDQLYEATNLTQVIVCLSQVGVEAQSKPGYRGPQDFWMHKHQENKRNFSEEKLRAGETVIGLQMGTNKGANASGISFGAQRHINDMH